MELSEGPALLLSLHFTTLFNFSGNPAITLPAGSSSCGLPIGIQLAGRYLSEDLLLRGVHAWKIGWLTSNVIQGRLPRPQPGQNSL
jgi:amidase